MASDRIAAIVDAGQPYMHDPRLRGRLHRITIPVLVLWGAHDGIVPVTYQCAYVDCLPNARLHLIANAGHMPHIEQPARLRQAIPHFVDGLAKQLAVDCRIHVFPASERSSAVR
jgi:pimeloyl-ACP methyl ester carboxylesterase